MKIVLELLKMMWNNIFILMIILIALPVSLSSALLGKDMNESFESIINSLGEAV